MAEEERVVSSANAEQEPSYVWRPLVREEKREKLQSSEGGDQLSSQLVKVFSYTTVVSKRAEERKRWKKFGSEESKAGESKLATTFANENHWFPSYRQVQEEEQDLVQKMQSKRGDMNKEMVEQIKKIQEIEETGKSRRPAAKTGLRGKQRAEEEVVEDKKVLKVQPITPETDEQDLTEAFEQFGKVIRVRIPKHPDSNKLKGFAFIHFEQERHAAAALNVSVFRFGGAQ